MKLLFLLLTFTTAPVAGAVRGETQVLEDLLDIPCGDAKSPNSVMVIDDDRVDGIECLAALLPYTGKDNSFLLTTNNCFYAGHLSYWRHRHVVSLKSSRKRYKEVLYDMDPFGMRQHSPAVITVKAKLHEDQQMSPLCIGEDEYDEDRRLEQVPISLQPSQGGKMSQFSLKTATRETLVLHSGAPIICKLDGKWTQVGIYSPDTEFKGRQHTFLPLDDVYLDWMQSTGKRIAKYGRRDRY
uniref:Peptidase S1 domain-containing protein n=1 Tax=Trichuris muris TaxID=70415 RepID=A0A5S6QRJ2_TRIMR